MSSLKEIKGRIASVKSTQKITSAMKMVASAKLRKAQYQLDSFLPYQQKMNEMLNSFLSSTIDYKSHLLTEEREIKRIAIVVFSSNTSLCGAFNSNVIKLLNDTINKYKHLNPKDIDIYAVGKRIEDHVYKSGCFFEIKGNHAELIDKPNFAGAKQIADKLISDFLSYKIDKVELLYNHCKNATLQIATIESYLPIQLVKQLEISSSSRTDYIIEPDKNTVLNILIPKSLHNKIYTVLLYSAVAEQAARVVAMQIATDNASDILDELTIQYNKQRQQVITSELLDIIGGSEALK